jgi:hypothetical protein
MMQKTYAARPRGLGSDASGLARVEVSGVQVEHQLRFTTVSGIWVSIFMPRGTSQTERELHPINRRPTDSKEKSPVDPR